MVARLQRLEIEIDRGTGYLWHGRSICLDGAMMRGGEGHGPAVVKILQNSHAQRTTFHGVSAGAQLVQEHQRMRGDLFHHGANVGQMRRKRAEILLQALLVSKIDKDLSKEGQHAVSLRWNMEP